MAKVTPVYQKSSLGTVQFLQSIRNIQTNIYTHIPLCFNSKISLLLSIKSYESLLYSMHDANLYLSHAASLIIKTKMDLPPLFISPKISSYLNKGNSTVKERL